MSGALDLGQGHTLEFVGWHPDDLPENRATFGVPLPSVERAAFSIAHLNRSTGEPCVSGGYLDSPELRRFPASFAAAAIWQVESWDPLTLGPSIRCLRCGDHGFVREGRWVPA